MLAGTELARKKLKNENILLIFISEATCVHPSTSSKCFPSHFQSDIYFILIYLVYTLPRITWWAFRVWLAAHHPAESCVGISSRGQGGPRPPSSEQDTGSLVGWLSSHVTSENLCTCNCAKSEASKQHWDSASKLTSIIYFHFQLCGYFCCSHFYFQPQNSVNYHKTRFYNPSTSQHPLFPLTEHKKSCSGYIC